MSAFKNKVTRWLAPYQYPQRVFANEIIKLIAKKDTVTLTILDCPCGNGEVSYHLSKLPRASVTGVDIEEQAIANAVRNFKNPNLEFKTADIFDILSGTKKYDVICIVNSLFLLPKHNELFQRVHNALRDAGSSFILIIPNTEGDNFKAFQTLNPGINKTVITTGELKTKAAEMCFTINNIKEIAFAGYYGRGELRFFSVFAPFYLQFLNFCKGLMKHKKGNYILYRLNKNYEGI